jgi:hypothetical protein
MAAIPEVSRFPHMETFYHQNVCSGPVSMVKAGVDECDDSAM